MKLNRIKKRLAFIAGLITGGLILAIFVFTLGQRDKEEVFPTFQDVSGVIETELGDFKLDKQVYLGQPDAPVKVIGFVDYKCPYCAAWTNNNMQSFKTDYIDTGKVQLFLINFSFLGPDSIKAAMVAEILWKQNHLGFWQYHNALYANQGEEQDIWANEEYLLSLIKEHVPFGDAARVKDSLDRLEGLSEVKEDFEITITNEVSSVPTFIVGDEKLVNPTLSELYGAIDSASVSRD